MAGIGEDRAALRMQQNMEEWEALKTYPPENYTGEWAWRWKTGKVAATFHYKNGVFDGEIVYYHKNGRISKEENYSDGKPNGLFLQYENNGVLTSRKNYQHGALHGIVEDWNYRGRLLGTRYYVSGKEVAKQEYIDAAGKDPTLTKLTE